MEYKPKLFIGVCNSQEFVPADFHWSWEMMEKPYEYVKIRFTHSDDVIRNNQMIDLFLQGDADIMIKMDIDQAYPKHFLSFLVPQVESHKVVGPVIFNKWRNRNYPPLLFETNDFPHMSRPMERHYGLAPIPYSHTNLLYAREVLEKLEPPWYEAHHDQRGMGRTHDVDYTFTDKIKAAGYEIYIDGSLEVAHLVAEPIDSKLSYRWNWSGATAAI